MIRYIKNRVDIMTFKNNKIKLLFIIGVILLTIEVSFSFFMASTFMDNKATPTTSTMVSLEDTKFEIEGKLSINDVSIYPGHKNVSSIKVTARGDHTINYNLVWDGINSLERLDYKVYKTTTEIIPTITCKLLADANNGLTKYYEECNISNISELGEVISSGSINKNSEITKEILKSNESITATPDGTVVYYYVVLEFPNLDLDQNIDMNSKFEGIVTVESTEVEYDKPEVIIKNSDSTTNTITLNLEGIKAEREIDKYFYKVGNAEYQETKNTNITLTGLKQNTEYTITVYTIDRGGVKSEEINTKIKTKQEILTMTQVLNKYTKNNSRSGSITGSFTTSTPTTVYSKEDNNGTSYVFAGVNPNNWVRIGNFYFRIIRFNGNGSMRLIYSGSGSAQTSGTGTLIGTKAFNSSYNDNMYVGLQYTSGNAHGRNQNSTVLGEANTTDTTTLYGWYNINIKAKYESIIDSNAGFCSDRTHSTSSSGAPANPGNAGTGTTATYYGSRYRYYDGSSYRATYTPTLKCTNSSDILKIPVGLITADEYALAGGGGGVINKNTVFWLHTGEDYWTMSPTAFDGTYARLFRVYSSNGCLTDGGATTNTHGIRPVINLKTNTTFLSGDYDGSAKKPWTVSITE